MKLRLASITYAAEGTNTYEFRSLDGAELLAYEPGAHIGLHLPNGIAREYSLTRPYQAGEGYLVGIKRDAASKGGSRYIHDNCRVGQIFEIEAPKNNFPLHAGDAPAVLIAGGIGVTPIWCMAQHLVAQGRPFDLHYAARTREEAAFLKEMAPLGDKLNLHIDAERSGKFLDVGAIVRSAPAGAHLYCCGPLPMLEAFEKAMEDLPIERKHVEYFSSPNAPAVEGGYTVVLARSGREVLIKPGITILETLRALGMNVPASCEQGVCGTCETKVIKGQPDHRDILLTPQEKASNKTMMICCSGSLDPRLVLDL
ncbi:MAG: PDR/VanB family oxidoreductase [Alphaproteobacteria bacterium]